MRIRYDFTFEDGIRKIFNIKLDPKSLNVIPSEIKSGAEWARISNCRCPNCRLNTNSDRYCPIAINIREVVDFFKAYTSYNKVTVLVLTEDRFYGKKTTVQKALGSLMGVYMAASGCPSMEKLKPLVRFHLPFATIDETIFRSTSSYLLGQYFLKKHGKPADMDLIGLADLYKEIQMVNRSMADRIHGVVGKDAINNALICLDMFAKELPYAIEDSLEELRTLFNVY